VDKYPVLGRIYIVNHIFKREQKAVISARTKHGGRSLALLGQCRLFAATLSNPIQGFGVPAVQEMQRNKAFVSGGTNTAAIFNAPFIAHRSPIPVVEIMLGFLPSHATSFRFGEIEAMGIYRLTVLDDLPIDQLVDPDTVFAVF